MIHQLPSELTLCPYQNTSLEKLMLDNVNVNALATPFDLVTSIPLNTDLIYAVIVKKVKYLHSSSSNTAMGSPYDKEFHYSGTFNNRCSVIYAYLSQKVDRYPSKRGSSR